MMMATSTIKENIAVVSINHPPVNALGKLVRSTLFSLITEAIKDDKVKGIIICGSNSMFSAGADISEFGSPKSTSFPTIYDIVMLLESSRKVTLAAIHGNAFGGGLELALGCHYRSSLTSARFSFPEVKLGILPGAGGTQRFPRVVGLIEGLKWITSGGEYSAEHAFFCGLVDRVFSDDLLNCSIKFIKDIIIGNYNLEARRLSCLAIKAEDNVESKIVEQAKQLGKRFRGAVAPLLCWHTLMNAKYSTYEDGILFEKQAVSLLANSDQSKALIYTFFAERAANKWTTSFGATYLSDKPLNVKTVGVIGLGTMGRGIALAFLTKGFIVYVFEQNKSAMENGLHYIQNVLSKKLPNKSIYQKISACLLPSSNFNDLKLVDLVVECVFESMELKQKIFKYLDSVCKPSTILASNTSALNIKRIAHATNRPNMVVGMHFFAPAHLMPLLENIYTEDTSPAVLATVMHVGKILGKHPVLVGNCHGFVGNRMYAAYTTESDFMLEEGSYPHEIDKALQDFGFPMGRYEVGDLSGNDVGYKVRQGLGLNMKDQPPGTPETIRNGLRYSSLADLLVESGRCGQKTNWKGWYNYEGRKPIPSPFVKKLIDDYRKRNKFTTRKIYKQEILERMLFPLINEGFRILEEGIASKASDIDVVWVNGYSWPRHTGGPMYYSHTIGLPHVLDVLRRRWEQSDKKELHWKPSQLLIFLVENFQNPAPNDWVKLSKDYLKKKWKISL